MRQLWLFLVRNHLVFLFFALLSIGFSLLFSRSNYQRNKWLHGTSIVQSKINERQQKAQSYFDLKWQNDMLIQENFHLRTLLEDAEENSRFSVVNYTKDSVLNAKYEFKPATVVSNQLNGVFNHITVDLGKVDSIKVGDGILTSGGVVGKVVKTSKHYSLIMPLFNRNMRLNVQHKNSGYNGNLVWDGSSFDKLQVENIPRNASVKLGDTIIVNQFSKSFPINSLVGTVQKVGYEASGNFYALSLTPLVDFRRLNHVYIAHRKDIDEILELESATEPGTP